MQRSMPHAAVHRFNALFILAPFFSALDLSFKGESCIFFYYGFYGIREMHVMEGRNKLTLFVESVNVAYLIKLDFIFIRF